MSHLTAPYGEFKPSPTRELESAAAITDELARLELGLMSESGFSPCAISLTPYRLTAKRWAEANKIATALGILFDAVAIDRVWLSASLAGFSGPQAPITLLGELLNRWLRLSDGDLRATPVNVIRHDFLLDRLGGWKLVESNSIAAGMGPFGELTSKVQQSLCKNRDEHFFSNPATRRQAEELYRSAQAVRGVMDPLIIFVVEADEDNIYDQQKLAQSIVDLGGHVLFKTMAELEKNLTATGDYRLRLDELTIVDLLYFRTGYNLEDYGSSVDDVHSLLDFRLWLEGHRVALCPSVAMQLSTSKWIQMSLSQLDETAISAQFGLNPLNAQVTQRALATDYVLPISSQQANRYLDTNDWLLKGMGEGGGHVQSAHDHNDNSLEYGTLLMKKIDAELRTGPVTRLKNGRLQTCFNIQSELGIFTVGSDHHYGGYLLRSKSSAALETGVHKGQGMLDAVVQDDSASTPREK